MENSIHINATMPLTHEENFDAETLIFFLLTFY